MDVKVEKVLEDGAYDAKLMNVEQKETKFGDRLCGPLRLKERTPRWSASPA